MYMVCMCALPVRVYTCVRAHAVCLCVRARERESLCPLGGGEEEGTAKPLCWPPGQVWLGKGGQGDGKLIVTERAGDTAQPRNMLYLLRGTS